MHWHAIKQSTGPSHDASPGLPNVGMPQLDGNDGRAKDQISTTDGDLQFPTGDDACDLRSSNPRRIGRGIPVLAAVPEDLQKPVEATLQLRSPETSQNAIDKTNVIASEAWIHPSRTGSRNELVPLSSKATIEHNQTESDRSTLPFLQISIPMHPTNNLAPFAYQRALRNRIRDDELGPRRKYNIKAYTPMFVHDCLMLPGSLANTCEKGSAEDVLRRMTPAFLPGFHAHVHATTNEPMIFQSSRPGDHAHGMLIFGQSKKSRRSVHEHYRPFCKRIKVEVELDTVHPVPRHLRSRSDECWELRRRSVWAHAWIWRDAHSPDARLGMHGAGDGWRFDDFLAGAYETKGSLRVEPAGWIDYDRETIDEGEEGEESWCGGIADEGWKHVQDEQLGSWEESSGCGGAVAWDDASWPSKVKGEEYEEEDEGQDLFYINSSALDRDYDRSGSAGCW